MPDARPSDHRFHKAWLVLALVGGFFLVWAAVWQRVGDRVTQGERYKLSPEQIEITAPPPWVQADVQAETLRSAALDRPLPILDEQTTKRVFEAFSLHPWVKRVVRVTRRPGPRVMVDLEYRRPACMVQLPANLAGDASPGEILVYAVDDEGVLLPSGDFSSDAAGRYPLLTGVQTLPGQVGEAWGDEYVHGGARLAAELEEKWHEYGLLHIAAEAPAAANGGSNPAGYRLIGPSGIEILWGAAPDGSLAGHEIARNKLTALADRFAVAATEPKDAKSLVIDLRAIAP